ncbi:hypothetical protein ACH5RR_017707 [Cinchona calisaya]|uniref:F-box domain-containing protein n=1 Tax=Cinchona calisaya TaxID=153742 RepID=A0ABD2ZPB1_9GENT
MNELRKHWGTGTKNNSNMKREIFLPDDIIIEILSRLPVQSLGRCTCVCKLWYTIIQDRKFTEMQLRRSRCVLDYGDQEIFKYLNNRDGFLLEQSNLTGKYHIRNPTTKRVFDLPDPHGKSKHMRMINSPKNYNYKLICVYPKEGTENGGCQVLTVGTDITWRDLECPGLHNLGKEGEWFFSQSTEDTFFVIRFFNPRFGVSEVVCLDIESEHFAHVKIPQAYFSSFECVAFFSSENKLYLANLVEQELHIWILVDYKKQLWSERKIVSIPSTLFSNYPKTLDTLLPLSLCEDWLWFRRCDHSLIAYNTRTKLIDSYPPPSGKRLSRCFIPSLEEIFAAKNDEPDIKRQRGSSPEEESRNKMLFAPEISVVQPFMPTELIVEILKWLPVEALLRLKCVCKLWCAIIKEESFIKKHRKCNEFTKMWEENNTTPNPDGSAGDKKTFVYISSKHGLVLERSNSNSPIYYRLRNPSTKQILDLPSIPDQCSTVCMFYLPNVDKYKLAYVCYKKLDTELGVCRVLTAGTDVDWRSIDIPSSGKLQGCPKKEIATGRIGKLLFIFQYGYSNIVRIEMESECITTIEIPQALLSRREDLSLSCWNGTFALARFEKENLIFLGLWFYGSLDCPNCPDGVIIPSLVRDNESQIRYEERNIPDDIIIEILSKLPAQSLGRCKCVCKLWCVIIEDRKFIEVLLGRSRCVFVYGDEEIFKFLYKDGLLLKQSSLTGKYSIRNPATNYVFDLPDPHGKSKHMSMLYSPKNNNYKLAYIYRKEGTENGGCQVLTVGNDVNWRDLDCPGFHNLGNEGDQFCSLATKDTFFVTRFFNPGFGVCVVV